MSARPKVSVIVAAYRPGDAFARVMDSLDAQSLPQAQFETIVVDDGSPDDTHDRLVALAATRPNLRVERIENSGWPSRPRNVAIRIARGDYLLFMDHDDSLYPDALRRMVEYAAETRADVLSPKESKTSDAWWGMTALADGNVPNAIVDGGIERLLPMVPHKLYRRAFLLEHDITFPEGRRRLWEDVYVNCQAWRYAERVAVLADTPVYLWHSTGTNNSKSYGPASSEFWYRLDELFAFIDTTLDVDALARRSALLHQYRGRVLLRLSRMLRRATGPEIVMAVERAGRIQERYVPADWEADLGLQVRARSILLRQGRPDLMAMLWELDSDTSCHVTATRAVWEEGALDLRIDAQWRTRKGDPMGLVRVGDRLHRDLPPLLRAALPDEVVDFTETLGEFCLDLGIRDRRAHVTWPVPLQQRAEWRDLPDGRVAPLITARAVLDPAVVAHGRPLKMSVHDIVARVRWNAASRSGSVRYIGAAAPAILLGGTAVVYASRRGTLALDSSATLRNVLADGLVTSGPVLGPTLPLPLPEVAVFAGTRIRAAAMLRAMDGEDEHVVHGGLVASDGTARLGLVGLDAVPAGEYVLGLRLGDGPFVGARPVRLSDGALTIRPPAAARADRGTTPLLRLVTEGITASLRRAERRARRHMRALLARP